MLLAVGLLTALCVCSAGPDELAGTWTEEIATGNLLGPPGAWVARELVAALGVSVYVLLASWFVLVVLLFLRQSWWVWARRLIGWAQR